MLCFEIYSTYPLDLRRICIFSDVARDRGSIAACKLCDLVPGECVGYDGKKIFEHFLQSCPLLATEFIVCIIKIPPYSPSEQVR